MNAYRTVLLYSGAATQVAKLVSVAAQVAGAQGASIEALCPPDGVDCDGVQRLLAARSTAGTCHALAEGVAPLVERTRGADLLVLSQPYFDASQVPGLQFASQLLVGASCPVLFVPRPAELGTRCASRVLVAWDGGREGARALRDALPLLQRAESVAVYAYGSARGPAASTLPQACDYLRRHGVEPRHAVQRMGDADYARNSTMTPTLLDATVGELLLSDAADLAADLLVMGAYGHSRTQELVLGGVTRSLLSSMTLPVLMSH